MFSSDEAQNLLNLIRNSQIDEPSRIKQFDELMFSHDINNPIDPETDDTPIMVAAKFNRAALIKHIFDKNGKYKDNAYLDPQDENGDTLLHHAVRLYHYEATKALCEAGTLPSRWNNSFQTALDYAIQNRQLKIISVLLHHGAFPNKTNLQKIWDIIKINDPVKFKKYIQRSINAIGKDYPRTAVAMLNFLNARALKEEKANTLATINTAVAPKNGPLTPIVLPNKPADPKSPITPRKLTPRPIVTTSTLLHALKKPDCKLPDVSSEVKITVEMSKGAPTNLLQPLVNTSNQSLSPIKEIPTPASPSPHPSYGPKSKSAPTSPALCPASTADQLKAWHNMFNKARNNRTSASTAPSFIPPLLLAS